MDVFRSRSSRLISTLPTKLYRALPAVILGTLFNSLDSVSAGILIFPTDGGAFRSLQLQGLSMYIMSTLTSQLVMTLGGSQFPGALGAMLIEILPFLRGIATDILGALGDNHPGLIPTVMAAYALTSFLTGAAFVALGLLKLGIFVAYFPQTVLTGAVGAIGVSLFVLGLELPFPPSATALALSNAASMLFAKSHLGLLAASFVPAFLLSISLRARFLELWTRGFIRSAYYIPLYLLTIPVIFWIAVHSFNFSKDHLVATGWLFTVHSAAGSSEALARSWNYWTLFDFRLVEWSSLKSATPNIVLLVVIGVLNLPIYVPTLAFTLDLSYDMNHELLGQGAANIFAGVVGTVPNILQYSYSVYVTRAKGGRFELSLVILLTGSVFLVAGLLLPYVPTILASALVLFIGVELFLEATWEASKTLAGMEYAIVLATLTACTFLGFAEGFGVGIGAATVVYLLYGVIDSPARVTRWNDWNELQQLRSQDDDHVAAPMTGRLVSPRIQAPASINLGAPLPSVSIENPGAAAPTSEDDDLLRKLNAHVVVLTGYIFFASVPSMEKQLLNSSAPAAFYILDLTRAHRIETAAARCLPRCVRDLEIQGRVLVICGLVSGSGLHADFERAEVTVVFDATGENSQGKGIPAFATRAACLAWCQRQQETRMSVNEAQELDEQAQESAYRTFCRLFNFELDEVLGAVEDEPHTESTPVPDIARFVNAGGSIRAYLAGEALGRTGIAFVIEGQIELATPTPPAPDRGALRPSIQRLLTMLPRETLRAVRARWSVFSRRETASLSRFKAGDILDCPAPMGSAAANKRSVVVEMEGETLTAWAQAKLG
ncbi:sulfate transporter family-domain-containing protein [Mycena galericulata]|nr:sulfate transporter family-domain-containing protein [Mycena galericulata]